MNKKVIGIFVCILFFGAGITTFVNGEISYNENDCIIKTSIVSTNEDF